MTLELSRLAVPWMRIPVLLTLVFTAVLVLVRAPAGAQPQIFFVAFMSLAVLQTPFHGGSLSLAAVSSTPCRFCTMSLSSNRISLVDTLSVTAASNATSDEV